MNNKVIIGVVVAVLVIGGGWYFMSGRGGSSAQPDSMRALLASSDTLECSFSDNNAQANTTGTMYVSNGRVRGDFSSVLNAQGNQKVDSHLITDGKRVNVWTSMTAQGIEMMIDPTQVDANGKSTQVDFDKKMNYNCKSWTLDESKFALPSDIKFVAPGTVPNPPAQAPAPAGTTTKAATTTR